MIAEIADLERTEAECGRRLDEVRKAVQDVMWEQYVEAEMRDMFLDVEAACDRAHEDKYPEQLEQVTELIQETRKTIHDYEKWIPHEQTVDLQSKELWKGELEMNLKWLRRQWVRNQLLK